MHCEYIQWTTWLPRWPLNWLYTVTFYYKIYALIENWDQYVLILESLYQTTDMGSEIFIYNNILVSRQKYSCIGFMYVKGAVHWKYSFICHVFGKINTYSNFSFSDVINHYIHTYWLTDTETKLTKYDKISEFLLENFWQSARLVLIKKSLCIHRWSLW